MVKRYWLTRETVLKIKNKVFGSKKNKPCYYCGIKLTKDKATLEHIVPISKGGTFALDNLAIACKACNQEKGNKDCVEFVKGLIKKDLEQKINCN